MTALIVLPLDVSNPLDQRPEFLGGHVCADSAEPLLNLRNQIVRRIERSAREGALGAAAIVTDG